MNEEEIKKIESAVSQSGFPLEHYIGSVLRKHNWRIITNRYYIDDVKNIEREIDILAYKTSINKKEGFIYYTGLLISCKKSEKRTWCFLTREADSTDENIDWSPLHFCTSDERLKYMTEQHKDYFIDKYKKHSAVKHLYDFPESIFAFQQLVTAESNRNGHKAGDCYIDGNDDIYNSIITSIKALETEKHSRIEHMSKKKYKKYYMFHLVSVFDGKMIKDFFDDDGKQHITEIQEIKYLNRHIVNKKENFYIVNFIAKNNFEYRLKLWDYFHTYNSEQLNSAITDYYKDIFSEKGKANLLWNHFKEATLWKIRFSLLRLKEGDNPFENLNMLYSYNEGKLELELWAKQYIEEDIVDKLNSDKSLKEFIQKKLLEIYRYKGDFCFRNEVLPF